MYIVTRREYCVFNDEVGEPLNGGLGNCSGLERLAVGEICVPTCDEGYELTTPISCEDGITPSLRVGRCFSKYDLEADGRAPAVTDVNDAISEFELNISSWPLCGDAMGGAGACADIAVERAVLNISLPTMITSTMPDDARLNIMFRSAGSESMVTSISLHRLCASSTDGCASYVIGDVRLTKGSEGNTSLPGGMLEMYVDGAFRPVCGYLFTDNDYGVSAACRRMGFPDGGRIVWQNDDDGYAASRQASEGSVHSLNFDAKRIVRIAGGAFAGFASTVTLASFRNNDEFRDMPTWRDVGFGSALREMYLDAVGFTTLPSGGFLGLTGLETLSLSSAKSLIEIENGAFGGLVALQSLDLSRSGLNTFAQGMFAPLQNLRTLLLGHTPLVSGTIAVGTFDGLNLLEELYLEECNLHGEISSGHLRGLTFRLRRLVMSNNPNMSSIAHDAFDQIRGLESGGRRRLAFNAESMNSSNLQSLWLNDCSLVNLVPGTFSNMPNLTELMLFSNRLSSLRERVFADLSSLSTLHVQDNCIKSIEARAFENTPSLRRMDLSNQCLTRIESDAFAGTVFEEIDLSNNMVREISPDAFRNWTTSSASSCQDRSGWFLSDEVTSLGRDVESCSDYFVLPDMEQGRLLAHRGSGDLTASQACCALGGGFRYGTGLQMDSESVVTCRRRDDHGVRCECGDTKSQYDLMTTTCIYNCRDGRFFETNVSKFQSPWESWARRHNDSFSRSFGLCLECDEGSYSGGSVDGFVSECEVCLPGQYQPMRGQSACISCEEGRYTSDEASTECKTCDLGFTPETRIGSTSCVPLSAGYYGLGVPCAMNTFSQGGAVSCEDCPFGKTSDVGSSQCVECDFVFSLSKHCDVPVMGALIAICILLLVAGVYKLYSRQKKRAKHLASEVQTHVELAQTHKRLLRARARDIELLASAWRIEERDIQCTKKIASGSYGEVWRGVLKSRYDVAIKIMFDASSDIDNDEINFLRRCRHPRLVMFLGCGMRKNGDVFVVLEYCSRGTLADFLFEGPAPPAWPLRVSLFADVAEAMTFLHFTHQSIHRDLKPQNVLLEMEDDELRCKVADFNLSKCFGHADITDECLVSAGKSGQTTSSDSTSSVGDIELGRLGSGSSGGGERVGSSNKIFDSSDSPSSASSKSASSDVDKTMTGMIGTPAYIAPEIFTEDRYSQKIDVYSFAMMLYGGLSLKQPWYDVKFVYKIQRAVTSGQRPEIDPGDARGAPSDFVELMRACWAANPISRPPFNKIYERLVRMRVGCHLMKPRG
eukprot:g183.t1